MSLDRLSEKYSPSGSLVARTLTRAVRNTSLDEWSLLLRETLQNSVDARLSNSRPIHFHVTLDDASAEQRTALREDIFGDRIPSQLKSLSAALRESELPLLIIADWGTCGLGGPTTADVVTDDRTDFRDFFLNVGREETKSYQGGTFGLGRGVLFDISAAATIVVFTRTKAAGRPVVRLMGMSLSETYNHAGYRYTGRHWWGIDSNGQPAPVSGVNAERIAGRLGLGVIPEDSTGTAILVVAPRIPKNGYEDEPATLVDPLDEMINAAELYGWPLMLGRHGRPAVHFTFGHGNDYWKPAAPDDSGSPVRRFAEAYRIAEAGAAPEPPTSWKYRDIHFRAGRAEPKVLGNVVFSHFPPAIDSSPEGEDPDIPGAAIALMREPRMVIRYLPVPKHPAGSSTVGVFTADKAFDEVFAESEPVAHDDWIPAKIASAKNQRNPVKQTIDKIRQTIKDSWTTGQAPKTNGAGRDGLAPVIGDLLGGLVADTPGFGPPPTPKPGPKPTVRVRSTRAIVTPPHLRPAKGDAVVAVFPVQVTRVNAGTSVTLRAEAKVVLDRGLEGDDERPEGAPTPAVVGWETTDGQPMDDRARLTVDGSVSDLHVLVNQPIDTVVTVEVAASEAAE